MTRVGRTIHTDYDLGSNKVGAGNEEKPILMPAMIDGTIEEKLAAFKKQFNCLRLEVGSGVRPAPGYLHLDKEVGAKKPGIDFSCDFMENGLPDDTFDEVRNIHFFEHVYWMNCPWVMSEFNRILKMGGKLFIEVPDYDVAAKRGHTQAHLFFETLYMNNRGDGDAGSFDDFVPGFSHASVWNEDFLSRLARGCGFEVVRRRDLETASCHAWIGVLHLECTKISKPGTSGVVNNHIGIFSADNKWTAKYKERYGN
jgi:hypothetical protein